MNYTKLVTISNVTKIENKRDDLTVISTHNVFGVATVKINVTTIGIKGDSVSLNLINKLDNIINNPATTIQFAYDAGNIYQKNYYDTNMTLLFSVDFTYLNGNIATKTITDIATTETLTYTYSYLNNNIDSIAIQ